jgi:molybdate transport system permease protein
MMTSWTPDEIAALLLSIKVASLAVMASVPLAVLVAVYLARGRSWTKTLLDGLVHLPLVLPPVVTGYLLLRLFGRRGPIGSALEETLGIVLAFRWTGAALAAAVMGFPLLVRAVRLGVEGVDRRLEEAAATLGANRLWTFATVTLPLVVPGLLSGMVLAFAKALGEFGATITFVSNIPGETQTLALATYAYTQTPGGDAPAMRLAMLSIALSLGALFVAEALARRVTRRVESP